jgi:hypothetical protein
LLCCCYLQQRLHLLTHPPLLGGRGLQTATQQHGCSGKVLQRLPEEWRGINVDIGVDVHTLVGASFIVTRTSSGRRRRVAGSRLFGGWAALLPLIVPLTGLFQHWDHLSRLPVTGL